jgi:SAM-dependent methyltransferase
MTDRILAPLRVECAGRVREGLLAFGYKGEAVDLTPETPLGCLARAFTKHLPTPEADLRRVLGEAFFAACEEAGLWKRAADGVTGAVVLLAHEGSFLLHDHGSERVGEMELYWVMGVGASTMQVAHARPDRPYGRVLDLCCGGGIQALRLAPFAKEIVAVDRNPRAVNLGQFGAALNGIPHISFRESDFFSAVAGERFDAIVCNPPYVLSPEREKYYRDGGMEGDTLAEKVVRETPGYLTEGGRAYFVCDVATRHGVEAVDRLRAWVEGSGCDVLAIAAPAMAPLTYAGMWSKPESEEARGEMETKWVARFAELGIESVTHMLVAMRRRTGENWVVMDALPKRTEGHFGLQIDRRFAGQDFVRWDAAATWAARLRLVPEARLQRLVRAEGGRWVTEEAKVVLTEGLMYEFVVDPRTVDFLVMFDGSVTMEQVLGRLALAMNVNVEKVRSGWLGYVHQLAADGVLEVVC